MTNALSPQQARGIPEYTRALMYINYVLSVKWSYSEMHHRRKNIIPVKQLTSDQLEAIANDYREQGWVVNILTDDEHGRYLCFHYPYIDEEPNDATATAASTNP